MAKRPHEGNTQLYLVQRLGLPIQLLVRLTYVMAVFSPVIFLFPALYRWRRGMAFRLLLWGLQQAGAAFIKLGQWASTRPDILPQELCIALAELNTQAPAHRMAWNRHVLRRDLGAELEELFVNFDPIPIGSGTIAQVHRAHVNSSKGSFEVAVKICHPKISELIERDLCLLAVVTEIIHSLIPSLGWLNLPGEMQHFSTLMRQQLDLRYEAYTLEHFARNFSTWENVSVPRPVYPLVARRVLVETYAEGCSIGLYSNSSIEDILIGSENDIWRETKRQLATTGLTSFLQMLLWDNFVHADLHPGNILVRFVNPKGQVAYAGPPTRELVHRIAQESLRPQLVYLDTGLVAQLGRRDFQNFNDLFVALVVRGDGFRAGQLIIERCPQNTQFQVVSPNQFCEALDFLVRPIFRERPLELGRFAIGPTLFQVFDLVRAHHVHLDGSFTNLVMSFVCVEGLGRQLAPDLNLIPILARAAFQYLVTNVAIQL